MNTKTVVLNAKKMNFDGKLDFSILSSEVVVYDDTTPEELLERIQDADVIVTKEMPVSGDLIRQFPDSVKLICEAGTGYNNLDIPESILSNLLRNIHPDKRLVHKNRQKN